MARFGEGYCWTIRDDPSVCPYIKPEEGHLLSDIENRIREKCIDCPELRKDLKELANSRDPVFEVFLVLLDEMLSREQRFSSFIKSAEIKEEIFDVLVKLSSSLKPVLDRDEILYKALVAFTAGGGMGFNRAFALLAANGRLKGYFALGPLNPEEAISIWNGINEKNLTVGDLLKFSPYVFYKEREKFKDILEVMDFDIEDEPFKKLFKTGTAIVVGPGDDISPVLRSFYKDVPFCAVPLFSHRGRPLGAVLLDNFLTGREISHDEIKAMEIFATEVSIALERALTYEELEEKIEILEEANTRLRENQELIMRLRSEAVIGEMVLQLIHSFKNPVVAIAGLARVLKKKIQPNSGLSKYIDAILQEAIKLENTLRDFVGFVKTKYISEKSHIDVTRVIELLCQEKREKAKLQGVEIRLNLAKNLPLVLGNHYQLYTCIENLVNNSIEAMPKGGKLFIESGVQNGFIWISIRDTGPGIPEDVMKNLFKPFFTTKNIGSGLGLYTSKEIIEKMGGNIKVSCERGKGCKVTVSLPYVEVKEGEENTDS